MTTKIKRSQIATYIDVDPGSGEYELLGDGIVTGVINMNPKTTQEAYIHQDSATTTLEGYAPTMPIEATCKAGDPVFDFIDGLRKARAVLSEAETTVVNVWMYENDNAPTYPAEKQTVSVQIDSFGGEGGAAAKINFTLNFIGDPVQGTFNVGTGTFTPS